MALLVHPLALRLGPLLVAAAELNRASAQPTNRVQDLVAVVRPAERRLGQQLLDLWRELRQYSSSHLPRFPEISSWYATVLSRCTRAGQRRSQRAAARRACEVFISGVNVTSCLKTSTSPTARSVKLVSTTLGLRHARAQRDT